jgi:hypothetical protein
MAIRYNRDKSKKRKWFKEARQNGDVINATRIRPRKRKRKKRETKKRKTSVIQWMYVLNVFRGEACSWLPYVSSLSRVRFGYARIRRRPTRRCCLPNLFRYGSPIHHWMRM